MKKTSKSGLYKLLSLMLSLIIVFGGFVGAFGTPTYADAEEEQKNTVSVDNLSIKLFADYKSGEYKSYDPATWASGNFKIEAQTIEEFPVACVYYKKSTDGDDGWLCAEILSCESAEPGQDEGDQATPDESRTAQISSDVDFVIVPDSEEISESAYDIMFTNMAREQNADESYREHVYGSVFALRMDNVLDQLTAASDMPDSGYASKVKICGTCSDSSGISYLSYYYNGVNNYATLINGAFEVELQGDYVGSVVFTAVDSLGNFKTFTVDNIRIDNTAPVITLNDPVERWAKESIIVTGSASDAASGTAEVRYRVFKSGQEVSIDPKNDPKADFNPADGTFSITVKRSEIELAEGDDRDGEYNVVVYGVDNIANVPNVSSDYTGVAVNFDNKECTLFSLSCDPGTYTSGSITVSGKFSDAGAGFNSKNNSVLFRTVAPDGAASDWAPANSKSVNSDGELEFTILFNNKKDGKYRLTKTGEYKLEVTATDRLGNESTVDEALINNNTYPLILRVDMDPPVLTADSVEAFYSKNGSVEENVYTNKEVTVTGRFTEELTSMSKVAVKNGKTVLGETTDFEPTGNPNEYRFTVKLNPRTYKGGFTLEATDSAGAKKSYEVASPVLYMDNTAPTIDESDVSVANSSYTKKTTVSGVAKDADSGVKTVFYKKSADKVWKEVDENKLTLTDSGHTARFSFDTADDDTYFGNYDIMVEDKAGEKTGDTGNFTRLVECAYVRIDNTSPAVNSINTDYDGKWTNGNIKISVSASDVGEFKSGVKHILYSFEDNDSYPKNVEVTSKDSDGNYTFTIKASDLDSISGGYSGKLRVLAVDYAGNITPEGDGKTVTINVDTKKGTATLITEDIEWTNSDRVLEVTFLDNASGAGYNSGFSKAEYSRGDDHWQQITPKLKENTDNTYILTFEKQNYNGKYVIRFYDQAGTISNEISIENAKQDVSAPNVVKVDSTVLDWTNGTVTLSGTVKDTGITGLSDNSGIKDIYYKKANAGEWTLLPNDKIKIKESEKTAEFSVVLFADSYCGKYEFKCTDNAGNESQIMSSPEIKQDNIIPVVSEDMRISTVNWTTGEVTITGTVVDGDSTLVNNSGISKIFYKKISDKKWTELDTTRFAIYDDKKLAKYSIELAPDDYIGGYQIKCADAAENDSEVAVVFDKNKGTGIIKQDKTAPSLTLSRTEPVNVFKDIIDTITLGLFNFSDSNELTYKLTLSDNLSGLDFDALTVTYTDEDGSKISGKLLETFDCSVDITKTDDDETPLEATVQFTVKNNMYLENVQFAIKDMAQGLGSDGQSDIVIVDTVSPDRKVIYSTPVNPTFESGSNISDNVVSETDTLYYNEKATLTFRIDEKNFYPASNKAGSKVKPETVFTVKKNDLDFTNYQLTEWKKNDDGKYESVMTLIGDGVYNVGLSYTDYSDNKMAEFRSATIIIDDQKPEPTVTYDKTKIKRTIDSIDYYAEKMTLTLEMKEDNFNAIDVHFDINAVDSRGEKVEGAYSIGEWTIPDPEKRNVHQVKIDFNEDANYTFDFDYTDPANKKMDDYETYKFTVDTAAPVLTSVKYSKSVKDVILGNITFGYYSEPVQVDLEYFDATSGCYEYNREGILSSDASEIHKAIEQYKNKTGDIEDVKVGDPENGVTKISFIVPENLTDDNNFDGFLNTLMVDRSMNKMETTPKNDNNEYDPKEYFIVDNIKPDAKIEQEVKPVNTVVSGDKVTEYYNEDFKGTITINEAHFDGSLVDFRIDGSKYSLSWDTKGDVHKAAFSITSEGEHSYTLNYKDMSENVGSPISHENIIIDKRVPVVKVIYDNTDAVNTFDGRRYFDKAQTATLTITEANFNSADVKFDIKAVDSAGNNITSAYSMSEWSDDGEDHTIKITYDKDANLTFDIDYTDLAKWQIADYSPDLFTIDRVAPQAVNFTYPSYVSARDGKYFYNNNITVTVSCFDATSGVYAFDYEGILASDASSSNAAVVKTAIENASITVSGGTSTATFSIPASALSSINQFDGTITAVAHDRTGHDTTTADETRLVIDNIAPTATMTVSDPVQTVGSKRYYSGSITVDISITEANFSDATTTFMLDGSAVSLSFTSSGDVHTASYTISGDGSHEISLDCTDASSNGMNQLTETDMIIDTKKPTIAVNDSIFNNSANNNDKLTFSFSVTDDNMSESGVKASLKAVVTEADDEDPSSSISKLSQKEIDLGTPTHSGKTYTYSINNVEADGYYTFTCTATDYAKNSSTSLACTDSDKKKDTVETFSFSVNRNGSTYWVEANVDNDSYTNSDSIQVALHEINIDLMSDDTKLKIVNDNDTVDVVLDKNNFVMNSRPKNQIGGGWYESVYTLDNSYFTDDSRYSVTATSHDAAGNVNISSESQLSVIEFTVDRTAPVITSNVSDHQSINASEFDVEFKVAENNLDESSIDVVLNGEPIEYTETSGGSYKCKLSSGELYQDIVINAKDLAGNTAATYEVKDITVSTNPFVRWFANKTLFFLTLGGGLLAIGAAVFFIIRSRKKASAAK